MHARFGLESDLQAVEARLRAATASREPLLEEMARWVIDAGGKRLRPMSAFMAYRAVGGGEERFREMVDIAAGLELIHTATLVHDDVNDGAKMRRGRPSCHAQFGTAQAIIAGDFLFTQGFRISGTFERRVVDWTAEACQMLAEGEILQARFLNDPSIDLKGYLTLVERKTACFIATGIQIGAYLGGADDEVIASLGDFGRDLGVAFQIVDDILDVAGDREATGKHVGLDIRDGTPTLPSILTLRHDSYGGRLLEILSAERRGPHEVGEALQLIRGSGAIDEARRLAAQYGDSARRAAQAVTDPVWRGRLVELVDIVLARDR